MDNLLTIDHSVTIQSLRTVRYFFITEPILRKVICTYIGVYNSENYWVFGLFPSFGILKTVKHNVSETGSVSVLRGRERHLLPWVP
jgi:hypothetical protein